jgi:hypothetical protein
MARPFISANAMAHCNADIRRRKRRDIANRGPRLLRRRQKLIIVRRPKTAAPGMRPTKGFMGSTTPSKVVPNAEPMVPATSGPGTLARFETEGFARLSDHARSLFLA